MEHRNLHAASAIALTTALLTSTAFGQIQFGDLGDDSLPKATDRSGEIVLQDLDRDGDLDIVLANRGQQNALYLNDGGGRFIDVTASHFPKDTANSNGITATDVDGDKDIDLVFANFGEQNTLYLNDGSGKFVDATATALPKLVDRTSAAAAGDIDGDGDVDLVFANSESSSATPSRILLNDGKGKFTDTASNLSHKAVSVILFDVDNDRDLDMVLGHAGAQDLLYLNDGKGGFSDVTATNFPSEFYHTYGMAVGDVDRDGDPDLVLAAFGAWPRVYLNSGKGKFTDVSSTSIPKRWDGISRVVLGDVDSDGDLDIVCANSKFLLGSQSRLLLNDGKAVFTDVTTMRLPRESNATVSAALGDVDGDQDLDLVLVNSGAQTALLHNLHRHVHSRSRAVLGKSYQLDLYGMPRYARAGQVLAPFVNLTPANPAHSRPAVRSPRPEPCGAGRDPASHAPVSRGCHLARLHRSEPRRARRQDAALAGAGDPPSGTSRGRADQRAREPDYEELSTHRAMSHR